MKEGSNVITFQKRKKENDFIVVPQLSFQGELILHMILTAEKAHMHCSHLAFIQSRNNFPEEFLNSYRVLI